MLSYTDHFHIVCFIYSMVLEISNYFGLIMTGATRGTENAHSFRNTWYLCNTVHRVCKSGLISYEQFHVHVGCNINWGYVTRNHIINCRYNVMLKGQMPVHMLNKMYRIMLYFCLWSAKSFHLAWICIIAFAYCRTIAQNPCRDLCQTEPRLFPAFCHFL